MTLYAITIVPPTTLPNGYDRRPYVYVCNDLSGAAIARLNAIVTAITSGEHNPTPGRDGWTARPLSAAEIGAIQSDGESASRHYRLVSLPAVGFGSDLTRLA